MALLFGVMDTQNRDFWLWRYNPLKINWNLRIAFIGPIIDEIFKNFRISPKGLKNDPVTSINFFFGLLSRNNPKTTIMEKFWRKKFWRFFGFWHMIFGNFGLEKWKNYVRLKSTKNKFVATLEVLIALWWHIWAICNFSRISKFLW